MLVLSRKPNEKIIIGDNIEIIVVDVRDGKARLGITAPRNVSIHREEIYQKIVRENNENNTEGTKPIA